MYTFQSRVRYSEINQEHQLFSGLQQLSFRRSWSRHQLSGVQKTGVAFIFLAN